MLENRKLWNMKVPNRTILIGALGSYTKELVQGLDDLVKRTSEDHANYGIVDIGQNTDKSPGDLRSLAVTLNPEENHQLTEM